ncbi:MAG: BolA family protein [Pseudomonadota bacterium]|nr:BolA family transcriptional regulator [Gammaproteobacteria bacterium]MEC8012294.1 BolA family protein [Pseudomonadota bacterium]HBF08409.1 BolA family transcriptional regulator [Gammaproteobacteria bacterium]|tara:strand:- start:300 stop:611 length:312 start_codon:yes stop_codon:yes gene_type:complete
MSRAAILKQTFEQELNPQVIDLVDESHMHSGPALETHFKVTLVSEAFAGLNRVKRHQKVYGLVADEMTKGLHAIALHLFTPEEWAAKGAVPDSPNCRGGEKKA